ncbi:hypothetical protein CCACVL1_23627 [Corchorus capsularis]|uniref:PGG domain-containing protein n=1 Tax=Corchorus capsularis TaxID=210143 RepID=A0A1R3GTD4_COCAP|nr:hypothetical protein CCACVL1_23627 [Corchorus capsularis]
MDPRLYEAARNDAVEALSTLLREDPFILERGLLEAVPETCLHIAALAGSLNFVKEMMRLKPGFATKLNKDGFSPIHMASANGYVDIVKALLPTDTNLGRQISADGRTALHFATATGSVAVLRELAKSCPECLVDLTERQESALHLALKNNQVEAFKLLLEIMREINTLEMKSLVNVQDYDGNTVLHIATARRQLQAVKRLVELKVEVNIMNKCGSSALDMLCDTNRNVNEAHDKEMLEMLQQAGAVSSSGQNVVSIPNSSPQNHNQLQNLVTTPNNNNNNSTTDVQALQYQSRFMNIILRPYHICAKLWTTMIHEVESSSKETQSALMVVAVLIATITYQSVLSPVGGFIQIPANQKLKHLNGITVLATDVKMFLFIAFFSSIGFALSVLIIWMLTSRFPLKVLLRLAVITMSANFACMTFYISPLQFNAIFIIMALVFAAVVFNIIYFVIAWIFCKLWTSSRRLIQA